MDAQAFDTLTRTLHASGTRRGLLGVAAVLGAATSRLLLRDGEVAARRKGKRNGKLRGRRGRTQVQVCHNGKTLRVDRSAVRAIVLAGGNRGACGVKDQPGCERVLRAAGCTQGSDGLTVVWSCAVNTDLSGTNLDGCNLIGANLRQVLLNGATLQGSILNNAHVDGSQFHLAKLGRADLVEVTAVLANFGGADLPGTDLRNSDFTRASFNSAHITGSDTRGAKFQDADLRDVTWDSSRCPDGTFILSGATCCGHLNGWTTPDC